MAAVPGCIARGDTQEELLNNLRDSLEQHLFSASVQNSHRGIEKVVELDEWFRVDPKDIQDGLAEFPRCETIPADEAFAQIAGLSKEDWLKKVEDYKAKKSRTAR